MSKSPEVSVVMGVYNGQETLSETLDSVLTQEDVDLEFIVVNDGSTDSTLSILNKYAEKDNRIKILNQKNQGLTQSLIRGCAEAKGNFIARQDAGDISLAGRFENQAQCLRDNPEVVLVSCGTRFTGPKGELLHEILQTEEEASSGLKFLNIEEIKGPSHHGSTMFRKDDYNTVGGYRHYFQVAQDLDLWIRLVEQGKHRVIPKILYQASINNESISSIKRDQQIATAKLILDCAHKRKAGLSEQAILDRAIKITTDYKKTPSRLRQAEFYYFLACCADDKNNARYYYRQAILNNPLHLKAIYRLVQRIF